ncbi:hypothetical protein N7486_003145 [Penicillium sp. IBT 16267x]|nr:hypothetical protein N7486_003145 [Penicillium sp. IBT 16267x]
MFPKLKEDARYGRFAFDHFALARWIDESSETSQEQRDRLVWEYQKLTLIQRWPYQCRANSKLSPRLVSEADIQRIFVNNQTIHERNMTLVNRDGLQTVWLRTCYDPRFEGKYQRLMEAAGAGVLDYIRVLDDSTRYDFENRSEGFWRQVLAQRQVVDRRSRDQGEDREFALAELRIQAGIYLLDKDSIKSGVITVLWIDEHGNVAWESRLDPSTCDLEELADAIAQHPISLMESTGDEGCLVPWN